QHVAVGDVRIRAHRDRRDLEAALRRPLVQRLDVGDDLLEPESARVDAPRVQRPEHERVVGICRMPHPYLHRRHVTLTAVSRAPLSNSIQDYLKGIYKLQESGGRVTITAVARDQGVSPASASAMVKKLAALDLLEHEPYRGSRLTDAGER